MNLPVDTTSRAFNTSEQPKTSQPPTVSNANDQVPTAGNVAVVPIHKRMRLTDNVLSALHADFEANGAWAIERMRLEEPTQYVRLMVSLLPGILVKQFEQRRLSEASLMPVDQINDYARAKLLEHAVSTINENPGSMGNYSR